MEIEKHFVRGCALPEGRKSEGMVTPGSENLPEFCVRTLLKRVEVQITRDILRLHEALGDRETPNIVQERFRRLIAKREEMLQSVRAQLFAAA